MAVDVVAESGRKPVNMTRFSRSVERMSRLTRDGTGQPNLSCETKISGANGDRQIHLASADHQHQGWQLYPVDPCYIIYHDYTYHMY